MLVLVGDKFACVKIVGRANFMSSPEFKTLFGELSRKGYNRFVVDLSECTLMDSTFLGVLAGFGLMTGAESSAGKCDIELANPNARVFELLENLGVLPLFRITNGEPCLPDNVEPATSAVADPTAAEIKRICLEAHKALMEANQGNIARFKDVTQFLAEDLQKLEKPS
jgi:anti-anti-sigma regulatory factor